MAQNKAGLTPTKRRVIEALLTTATIRQAAEAAKVGERTIYRWLAEDPIFKAELVRREDQILDTATRLLIAGTGKAIQTLYELMNSNRTTDGIKLSAARVWMEQVLKLRELRDIEARLAALEARASDEQD